jgi:putative PIN family toxin of toxin-antitoxin system
MRRAVFDSTVLISAFLRSGGVSDELLGLAASDDFALLLAPEIISETRRKLLTSTRIRTHYQYTDERAHSFCRGLLRISHMIRNAPPITGVVRDPTDDMIVACAVHGRAEHVVTRDKDLLSIGSYRGVVMTTPEEFRMLLRSEE